MEASFVFFGPPFGYGEFYELGVGEEPFNKHACISFVGEGSFAIIEGQRNMLLDSEKKIIITDKPQNPKTPNISSEWPYY